MKKGLIRTVEVFLAIHILAMFLASIPILTIPQHEDPHNIKRLQRTSENLALSICNNEIHRETITENKTLPDIGALIGTIPDDINAGIKIYDENGNLVEEDKEFPNGTGIGTSSCMITSHTQNKATSSDTENIGTTLSSGNQYEISFNNIEPGYENILTMEANQSGTGETKILVQNETEKIEAGTISFFGTDFQEETLNLTNYLPDANNEFKITIEPTTETEYNDAQLDVTRVDPHYDPHKVVIGVWNE